MSKSNTPDIRKPEKTQVGGLLSVRSKWSRSVRLISTTEFQMVRKQGKTVHSSHLRISCLVMEKNAGKRIGLVTPRNVGGAVERNRIRRRLREIFRRQLPQIFPDRWVIVLVKTGATSLSFSDLQEECLLLARKLSILPDLS